MTEYATPGEPHTALPADIPEWTVTFGYSVIPWHCPRCEQVVAETVHNVGDNPVRTVLTIGPAPHWGEGDRDGIPYYGPTSREMRGHTPRRQVARLRREGFRRAWSQRMGEAPGTEDYGPIQDREFDTICDNCPMRVRIRIPPSH